MEPGTAVVVVVFDLLVVGECPVMALPYHRRRAILEALGIEGGWIGLTPSFCAADGPALYAATGEAGMEGVVAKRLDGPYRPGVR